MTTVNKTALYNKLQSYLNDYLSGSTATEDVLNLALSVWSMNESNIVVVNTNDDLPVLEQYDSPDAILCFINNTGVFAISSNKRWLTLDGRLIRDDTGTVVSFAYTWGLNTGGRLGDNTTSNSSSPVSVVGGFINWSSISAGACHTVALRSNNTAWSWGYNSSGELGDTTIVNRSSPVIVSGGITNWTQVSAGSKSTLARRSDGTAWSWGSNSYGQLGNGLTASAVSPVSVVGGFVDWCHISAGRYFGIGVRTDGTAWSWGRNLCGTLGTNNLTNSSSPVSVVGGFTDWCFVSAGLLHIIGVRTNGTAWAWGRNNCGATFFPAGTLGDNSVINRSSPVSVVGGFTDWCRVSAGGGQSIGLRSNGTVWAWGNGSGGRLGNNNSALFSSPVSVVGGFTDWCQTSAGYNQTVAVRTNATAWSWGPNTCGVLGDGTTVNKSSPVSVLGGFSQWCQVSGGLCHSAGVRFLC